jgi:uncharacterized protein YgbK (DUF1537 family)
MSDLLYAYYGDDFTGSTDVLESLADGGVEAVLFLVPPTADLLGRFPEARAIGLAGDSRSRSPDWMDRNLPRLYAALQAFGAPLVHYKTCSTFDSSPETGSIGRAMEIGAATFGGTVPILVGAPHLGRYVAFGNLFAAAGDGEVHRIDRHPTMSRHPVTPMHEADLRRHLSAQTDMVIGLVGLDRLKLGQGEPAYEAEVESGAEAVLFDGVDRDSLQAAGGIVRRRAGKGIRFAVGSSGVTRALIHSWKAAGLVQEEPRAAAIDAVDRLLVVSGSCSPVTAGQIQWALANDYAGVKADVPALLAGSAAEQARIEAEALAALAEGRSALIYSATGPLEAGRDPSGEGLGTALGRIARAIVARGGARRLLFAGGDTSSHAVAELGLFALTWAGATERGAPLCRAHAEDSAFDGLELVLKGGQMGSEDFFERVRNGD